MARASSYSYTTLDEQSGDSTYATGINSTDQIVGLYTNDTGNHGFLYNGSTYTNLDDPVGSGTEALGINDRGQIVGFYNNGVAHGFVYEGGTYTSLNDPVATNGTVAYGINDSGQVVGIYYSSGGAVQGFLYNGSTYATLDDRQGANTYATDINASGEILGSTTPRRNSPRWAPMGLFTTQVRIQLLTILWASTAPLRMALVIQARSSGFTTMPRTLPTGSRTTAARTSRLTVP
jgi:probable HAF family extracellular repeat protein